MQLIPTSVQNGVEHLRENISHLFELFVSKWHTGTKIEWLPNWSAFGEPGVDDDDEEVRVVADVPGLDDKDFKIEVMGDRLNIRGEKKAEWEEMKDGYFYHESRFGSFARSVRIPCEVEEDQIKAKYKNGCLTLSLPKTDEAKAKAKAVRIKV